MVTRKPTMGEPAGSLTESAVPPSDPHNHLPYPVTPVSPANIEQTELLGRHQQVPRAVISIAPDPQLILLEQSFGSSVDHRNTTDEADLYRPTVTVPKSLRPGGGNSRETSRERNTPPASLRPGPSDGHLPTSRASSRGSSHAGSGRSLSPGGFLREPSQPAASLRLSYDSTNPFTSDSTTQPPSLGAITGRAEDAPLQPPDAILGETSQVDSLGQPLSGLTLQSSSSIDGKNVEDNKTTLNSVVRYPESPVQENLPSQFPPHWNPESQPPLLPIELDVATEDHHRTHSDATVDSATSERTESVGWDPGADISTFDAFTSRNHGLENVAEAGEHGTWEEQMTWEKNERVKRERDAISAAGQAQAKERERMAEEEWHRGEQEAQFAASSSLTGDRGPSLPPRRSEEHLPEPSTAQRSQASAQKRTAETYQIKHVNWVDSAQSNKTRQSPVLVQNANGPCPLLALVNALTLSTPADIKTALVETLRVREQVSLGLLLDAVFDELTSGRRGDAMQSLPDVGDLYAFLVTLHTGMNVNPAFFPSAILGSTSGLGIETTLGSFEDTREMRLYSTFSVPLIHGWLPHPDHPAYAALLRSAKTYEDAQNLLFREEELEQKLQNEGLRSDEQQLLQDVATVKYFLSQSATQLTKHGLETMKASMKPGGFVILFRNDHFSTLYKHAHTHQLLQLVTDMGYARHQEVVWESLVDVTGERSSFLSGDFRPVGNNDSGRSKAEASDSYQSQGRTDEDEDGWTTVESRTFRSHKSKPTVGSIDTRLNSSVSVSGQERSDQNAPAPASAEQEDRDLALALQLQEEEDDRHRREIAARNRQESLSQQFIEQQHAPSSGGRRNGASSGGGQEVRPLIPPRRSQREPVSGRSGDAPPPTYEQAANDDLYYPPPHQPSHPTSSPTLATGRGRTASGRHSQGPRAEGQQPVESGRRRVDRGAASRLTEDQNVGHGSQSGARRRQGAIPAGPAAAVYGEHEGRKDCVLM